MKLRCKKNGEIVELKLMQIHDKYLVDREVEYLNGKKITLKLLADNFEEVKEPIIKNKEMRKAVKAWADACKVNYVVYKQATNEFYDVDCAGKNVIRFTCIPVELYLENEKQYTIVELCGDEE